MTKLMEKMMKTRLLLMWFLPTCWTFGYCASGAAQSTPHAGMLRYPDVSAEHIVFVYANDLWIAPREGGQALPLASPPGPETHPKFSPDGSHIAFVGNYDGDRDLYVVPRGGGVPRRVTHHPANEILTDWTPDNRLIFGMHGLAGLRSQRQIFTVSSQGGLPMRLPVPYGGNGALNDDGTILAYTPTYHDTATWKRYRGGLASDIWLFDLERLSSQRITSWEGTDSTPMWHGAQVYYLSDAGAEHRLNIWFFDTATGSGGQITHFSNHDVKWPSIGPGPQGRGEIIFQNGSAVHLLSLGDSRTHSVEITIPGARSQLRPRRVDAAALIHSADISPTGERAVFGARGDIWTNPAELGSPRNLTRTSGAHERDVAWSPNGRWIAYTSDVTGEYELYITQSDGKGETRQLTRGSRTFYRNPVWSPDSERIAFVDKTGAMLLLAIETGETVEFDRSPLGAARPTMSWSHDSRWIAYENVSEAQAQSIWVYNVEEGVKHRLTSDMFFDADPVFDRKGEYLYFASSRSFSPTYGDAGGVDQTFVYVGTQVLLAVPLRADAKDPYAPESDEESWIDEDSEATAGAEDDGEGEDRADDQTSDEGDSGEGEQESVNDDALAKVGEPDVATPVEIDLEDFERRAIRLPVPRGTFRNLAVNDAGQLIYVRRPAPGSSEPSSIKLFDINDKEREEKAVASGSSSFYMSANGKKILVDRGSTLSIQDASPGAEDKDVVTARMTVTVDPRSEWSQLFHEAWRLLRDFFYDPNMHGVDWEAVRLLYAAMLDDCASREDVGFVIGEMIGELNVSHSYYIAGRSGESQPTVAVGMLGCDYVLVSGENGPQAFRINRIYRGAAWDVDARGPLGALGVNVSEGDFLLAVNGEAIDTSMDPWAAFIGTAGRTITITVSSKPSVDEDAREVAIVPLADETNLRYRAWIERNRVYAAEHTDGQVGYIYVPNTGVSGQNDLVRQFYGQRDKAALIIDERWNGGGQTPTRFIELLNRPVSSYDAIRDGVPLPFPPDGHRGPKVMLINGHAGSGGDTLPFYFRQSGLGELIGTRTWGGVVGIGSSPALLDGSHVTIPGFAFYETDGTWAIEGHGVDPDIKVIDDPALMVDGGDPQLDAAIELMLQEIREHPFVSVPVPPYPDRSGVGVLDNEK